MNSGSLCIDAGFSLQSAAVDLDGHVRAVDDPATADTGVSILLTLTGQTLITDIGAYEFQPDVPCTPEIEGDINCDGVVNLFDFLLMAGNWLAGT